MLGFFPLADVNAVNRNNFVSGLKTGFGGNGILLDHADIRADFGNAEGKTQAVKQNRQREISQRTCGNDGDTFDGMLFVESVRQVCLRHLALARINHFDVTAQWDGRQTPFGIAALSAEKWFAEADGKADDFDAAQSGDDVVSELVQADQNQDGKNKS